MIPLNLETYSFTIFGNSTTTIFSPSSNDLNIVYSIALQQEKDLSDTIILCGDTILAKNYGKDYSQVYTMYNCGMNDVEIIKTGNDEAFVLVQILNDTPKFSGIGSSTTTITPDGALNGFFLLIIVFILTAFAVAKSIGYINVKRVYTGNNTIEGKEHIEY